MDSPEYYYQQYAPPPQSYYYPDNGLAPPVNAMYASNPITTSPIEIIEVSKYTKLWDDSNTKAYPHHVGFFRPQPPPGYFILGDLAQRSHKGEVLNSGERAQQAIALREREKGAWMGSMSGYGDDCTSYLPLLLPPVDYKLVWKYRNTKGKAKYGKIFLWEPVAPEGYASIGMVVTNTKCPPSPTDLPHLRCVHKSLVEDATFGFEPDTGACMWRSTNASPPSRPASIWRIQPKDYYSGSIPLATFWVSSTGVMPECDVFTLSGHVVHTAFQSTSSHNQSFTDHYNHAIIPSPSPLPTPERMECGVMIIPFEVQGEDARAHFDKWRKGLWFAPSWFTSSRELPLHLTPLFIPFYSFHCSVSSTYHGQVGKLTETTSVHLHLGGERRDHLTPHSTTSTSISWKSKTGTSSNMYTDLRVCGSPSRSTKKFLSRMKRFDTHLAVVGTTDPQNMEKIVTWHDAWAQGRVEMSLKRKEYNKCVAQLQSAYSCTRGVRVNTEIRKITYQTTYVPMYVGTVKHKDGKKYRVFVDGRTGQVEGDRPYGIGALTGAMDMLSLQEKEPVRVIHGKDLYAQDEVNAYSTSKWYLVFPKSSKMAVRGGWISLKNTSEYPIVISSQLRNDPDGKKHGMLQMKPHECTVQSFCGHWCLCIEEGDHEALTITGFERSGGKEVRRNNHLLMVPPGSWF